MDAIKLHPDHGGHELRCVTFGCARYDARLLDAAASDRIECLARHAVRCTDCHTWADLPARPRAAKRRRSHIQGFELDQDECDHSRRRLSLTSASGKLTTTLCEDCGHTWAERPGEQLTLF